VRSHEASKVRAIQGRSELPPAISTVVRAGRGAGGRVAVGVLTGVGEEVIVKVGERVGIGAVVKVAVGRGLGVGVGRLEIPSGSLTEEESQAGIRSNTDSKSRGKPLLVSKLQPSLDRADDIAVGQIHIQISSRACSCSVVLVPPDELGRDGVFIGQPTRQINDGP
jgi:hypothetical protein